MSHVASFQIKYINCLFFCGCWAHHILCLDCQFSRKKPYKIDVNAFSRQFSLSQKKKTHIVKHRSTFPPNNSIQNRNVRLLILHKLWIWHICCCSKTWWHFEIAIEHSKIRCNCSSSGFAHETIQKIAQFLQHFPIIMTLSYNIFTIRYMYQMPYTQNILCFRRI